VTWSASIPFIVGGALLGAVLGFLLARLGTKSLRREAARASAELARSEAHAREQTRLLARMQSEQASVAGVFRRLPDVVREMNRSELDATQISNLLFQMVQDVFQAEQVLLYLVPNAGAEGNRPEELVLQANRGVNNPDSVRRIKLGEGRIGFAAETKNEWLSEDWRNQSRTEGRAISDNHPSLRLDLIGPLVHYTKTETALLGVLCVGLSDKSTQPRDGKRLLQLITGLGSIAIMNARRVSELSAKANHDGLTGLVNKRHFLVELGAMIHRSEQENQPLGLFIFDIDHFKKYNDQNGHLKGDELLKAMAALLKGSVRPGDMVGRYGGEEFLVAMPRADREGALALAERIRQAVESNVFEHGEKQPMGKITVSGGVAAFPNDGAQSGELIHGADLALYEAKRAGRNRVFPFRRVDLGDATAPEPAHDAAPAEPDR